MNIFERLFGRKKEGREKIKKHQACNFGIKEFNHGKRSRNFIEEIRATERKKPSNPGQGHGQGGGGGNPNNPPPTEPPTQPPPSGNAVAVIFLDFDGAIVSGTSWNYSGDIVCEDSGMTLTEQDAVIASVLNDFSVFNANGERIRITTDPSVYNATAANRRGICVITETWEWFGQAGGVSFVDSFGDPTGSTCFVFSSLLGYSIKNVAEAVPHEIGHMFGCRHQSVYDANCVRISDYNTGADGEAPIMGVAYYQPVGRWWYGPTDQGCNVMQDDAAVITNKLNNLPA